MLTILQKVSEIDTLDYHYPQINSNANFTIITITIISLSSASPAIDIITLT